MDYEMEVDNHTLGYPSCDGIMYASLKNKWIFSVFFEN